MDDTTVVPIVVAAIGAVAALGVGLLNTRKLANVEQKVDGRLTELLDTTRRLAASQVSAAHAETAHVTSMAAKAADEKGMELK